MRAGVVTVTGMGAGCMRWCGQLWGGHAYATVPFLGGPNDIAYCTAACLRRAQAGALATQLNAKAAPAERQLAPGWERLTTPGRHNDGRTWFCCCPGPARATYARGLMGACEACTEKMGVFGPVAAPASKPTHVEAKANITPPCPACNGIPFEARRCPRCDLPSKAEPVRVRLAPVEACVGPLAVHGVAAMRVALTFGDREHKERPLCDACYLHFERALARNRAEIDALNAARSPAVAQPPARIGTVPMSIGPGAGVGIWASRGMRGR